MEFTAMSNETAVQFSSKGQKKTDAWTAEIELSNVHVLDGFNPRSMEHEKDIETLAKSIAKTGLINPPTVRPAKGKGEFELISGHRRFRALQSLGRTSAIFVVRTDLEDDTNALAYAVAENSQDGRTDLTYVELGRSFQKMVQEGWGVAKIATSSGVHQMTVRRALAIMELPEEILELVQEKILSESAALVYAKLDPEIQGLIPADKLEGASAHYIKELAKQAQKQLKQARKEAGVEEEEEPSGKKKGKVKINWRSPGDRTTAIRELAHIAFNPKNAGAPEAYKKLTVLYWVRGHGEQIGDLKNPEMELLIKGDNEAFLKSQAFKEEKEAKQREKEAGSKDKPAKKAKKKKS
jgi:ParB/RepB/Spo0J family partition protein